MGNRLSKIYTRTGDTGTTALADGTRVSKTGSAFVAMGDIDELNSHIGMVLALLNGVGGDTDTWYQASDLADEMVILQHLLFNLGGEIAMATTDYQGITAAHVAWLESNIDRMNECLPYLKEFILPKGGRLTCQVHIARSVARRAERSCIQLKLDNHTGIGDEAVKFINRLSDYLFVLARFATPKNSVQETLWDKKVLAEFE
ncbi:MAG: cob(I)yrinic acid a,c-diamide adenosyltransferase [Moraxella sp.]|nr:cob(I)yrinic acid a,c-diamide adenosyltransferase [Moraxella sp.]